MNDPIEAAFRRPPAARQIGLAAVLAFGVVGFSHVLAALLGGASGDLRSHVLWWLRGAALAFGPALLAVEAGLRFAARRPARPDVASVASVVSLAFGALTVPLGLEQGHLAGHHGHAIGVALDRAGGPWSVLAVLRDVLVAQTVALPIAAFGLLAFGLAVSPRSRRWSLRTANRRLRPGAALLTALSLAGAILTVAPAAAPPVAAAAPDPCSSGGPERAYDVSAINVRITYNRFGDNDPGGYMYAIDSKIPAIRNQEASRQVSTGLRKDAIQPLVLRANLGDCLVVPFTNRLTAGPHGDEGLGGPAPRTSFHVNGLSYAADQAGGAVGFNPDTTVAPGQSRTYRIAVTGDEGPHAVVPLGDNRAVTAHGLFGAVFAEPAGTTYLDPETASPTDGTGWESIIAAGTGPYFREFGILYHEVGDEKFNLKDANGSDLPTFDDLTQTYRPGTRAINYRSEPHMDRIRLGSDESQAYGSYAFGDPATPIPRSYLGEPTKTRLLQPAGEMAHVHHLHGGGDRWRRSPGADDTDIDGGLRKSVDRANSVRLDSQVVEPGEGFSLEHECGAGGCQQAAGDFLFHCHIAHHYVGGMWAFWRVFDTLQPDLATIPGRAPAPAAVRSDQLIGRVIEGKTIVPAASLSNPATQRSLENLVESQLPPQGVRIDAEDATVWDYAKSGTATAPVYLGEPEDTRVWADFASPTPGQRPVIMFNPTNGRYAWPLMRPHLAMRPPFAPNGHGGTPWLGETATPTRPDGLCPTGSFQRRYDISAITVPIKETDQGDVDKNGEIFVLNENRAAVLAGTKPAEPLAIRSNGGEAGNPARTGDCVAVTLSSGLVDNEENHQHSKVNIHTHFVQFDPQASDGVITGMSYEQSVRPFPTEHRTLIDRAPAGATTVHVTNTDRLRPGISVAVGQGEAGLEVRRITAVDAATGVLTLDQPLTSTHNAGQSTGVEFTQYRWFSDVDAGTVFWHDHVAGSISWDHGLFGAHIIEPPGSTYHDPKTGAEVRSGSIVDIHTNGSVGAGVAGSFREFMVWVHDDARARGNNGDGRGSINLLAEPLAERGGPADPYAFSSVKYGDPFTPIPRAYVGDNFVFRVLGVSDKEASLRLLGHRFRQERFNAGGTLIDSMTVGISERGDFVIDGGAGGPGHKPGDYLYYSTIQREWEDGAWGILRVHDTRQPDLQPLPAAPAPPTGQGFPRLTHTGAAPPEATTPGQPCPAGAPVRSYDVSSLRATLPLPAPDTAGTIYALDTDVAAIRAGTKPVEPLAIRAAAGECVEIRLTNLTDQRASLALGELVLDPQGSAGAAVGFNPDSTVAPGVTRTYRVYADKELGVLPFLNLADVSSLNHGAYGALVVEPAGASWTHPRTGAPVAGGLVADVTSPTGSFRELVDLFHDTDAEIGRSHMPYPRSVESAVGINYRAAPFKDRGAEDPSSGGREAPGAPVFSSRVNGDPATTLLRAYAGDPVRIRTSLPAGEQFHGFFVDGHQFPLDPGIPGSDELDVRTLGPGQAIDAYLTGGAGGPTAAPGDYLYGDRRLPYTEAGVWGLLRVHGSPQADLRPLPVPAPPPPAPKPIVVLQPASIDFGTVRVGTTSTAKTVKVTNQGDGALVIGTPAVSGPDAARFTVSAGGATCANASVPPGGSCTISLRFTPDRAGAATATLLIPSNADGSPSQVPLSGSGKGKGPAGGHKSLGLSVAVAGSSTPRLRLAM
jgi:hypothetical protein